MSESLDRDILNIEEAAQLLGVSIKTFNKVLHTADMPARKIGREWKFSRQALVDWVGSGHSQDYYRDGHENSGLSNSSGAGHQQAMGARDQDPDGPGRRTQGWRIELD